MMKVKLFTIRLSENDLEIDQNSLNDFLEMVTFTKSDTHFTECENDSYWSVVVHYEDFIEAKSAETKTIEVKQEYDLSEREQLIYQNLKQWRNEKAIELNLPHYMICHNSELLNVSLKKPENNSQLRKIKGFGEIKLDKYGDAIIALLNAV